MRILLVEDDQRTAEFINKGLKQSGYIVEHCGEGREALYKLSEDDYDAAVMDIMLPEMDGLQVIRKLRARGLTLPIIVLSAKKEVEERVKGLEAGADDYLVKPFAFAELLARLQTITRRLQPEQNLTTLTIADLSIDLLARKVSRGGTKLDLQPKEYALLEYLARHKGRVVSKTMIMENVWDFNFDPQTNIVESRICRLREKVDKRFDKKLIQTIRGMGYALDED